MNLIMNWKKIIEILILYIYYILNLKNYYRDILIKKHNVNKIIIIK